MHAALSRATYNRCTGTRRVGESAVVVPAVSPVATGVAVGAHASRRFEVRVPGFTPETEARSIPAMPVAAC
jgi:hypothetical protein